MNSPLFFLFKLKAKGSLRKVLKALKTPRQGIFIAVAGLWFIFAFGPALFNALQRGEPDLENVRLYFPVLLFFLFLTQMMAFSGGKAVNFSPPEIDFLFAAPISRRQLLIYRIGSYLPPVLFTTMIFSLIFLQWVGNWFYLFISLLLAMLFVYLLGIMVSLVQITLSEYIYTPIRRFFTFLISVLVLYTLWSVIPQPLRLPQLQEVNRFLASTPMQVVLAPFSVFANMVTAKSFAPDFLFWCSIAFLLNISAFAILIRLDANYLETSLQISSKIYERKQRMMRGGSMVDVSKSRTLKWRIPQLPWLNGAGPIIWRNLISLIRTLDSNYLLFFLILVASLTGPIVSYFGFRTETAFYALIMIVIYMSLFLSMHLRFDFRGDLDHISLFKRLPVSAQSVTMAELCIPVFFLSLVHILALTSFASYSSGMLGMTLLVIGCVIPFNLMMVGIQNFVFLIFPTRFVHTSPADLTQFGRNMAIFLIMFFLYLFFIGIAALFGLLAYWLSNYQVVSFAIVFATVLFMLSLIVIPMVAWAYVRFDVSTDMPA